MAEKPVKSNLFRFVTLRNPQLIEDKEKKTGFIFHPDEERSVFYAAIDGLEDRDKSNALDEASNVFSSSAYKTKAEARKPQEALYDFSTWLMRNKNNVSYKSVVANIGEARPQEPSDMFTVWDNLIYQTIKRTSVYVREACIQLLIANRFLTEFDAFSEDKPEDYSFSDDELEAFKRLANASVVISKNLFYDGEGTPAESTYPEKDAVAINSLESAVVAYNKVYYSKAKKELKKLKKTYDRDYNEAYSAALKAHNTQVENLIRSTKPTIVERVDELGNTTQIETYPNLKLPNFNFEYDVAVDDRYLARKVSDDTVTVFNALELDARADFSEILKTIDEELKATNKAQLKLKNKSKKKRIKVGGSTFKTGSPLHVHPYCFTAKFRLSVYGKESLVMH